MFERTFPYSNFQKMDMPFIYQGLEFSTVENFYQAMKSKDLSYRTKIAGLTPAAAKKAAKKVSLRPDWADIKLAVMTMGLEFKFTPTTSHGKKLIDDLDQITETNIWHDNYWGVCVCTQFTSSPYGVRQCMNGQNHLGKLLMEIREDLRKRVGF